MEILGVPLCVATCLDKSTLVWIKADRSTTLLSREHQGDTTRQLSAGNAGLGCTMGVLDKTRGGRLGFDKGLRQSE